MKAFRFPLQAILTLREEQEQEAQRAYARALRAVEAAERAVSAVERELADLASEQAARLRTGMTVDELRRLGGYRAVLDARGDAARSELARVSADAEDARQGLLAASRARQALEKYREKLQRAFAARVARAERVQLDDLAGRGTTLASAWRQSAQPTSP